MLMCVLIIWDLWKMQMLFQQVWGVVGYFVFLRRYLALLLFFGFEFRKILELLLKIEEFKQIGVQSIFSYSKCFISMVLDNVDVFEFLFCVQILEKFVFFCWSDLVGSVVIIFICEDFLEMCFFLGIYKYIWEVFCK